MNKEIKLLEMMDTLQIIDTKEKIQFPKIMGIINVTPDSFSDGEMYFQHKDAVRKALELVDEGADLIDIGGESARPGSESVSLEEELNRVIPVIRTLKHNRPNIKISIDTVKYEVARQALDLGVEIINDISGLTFEPRFLDLATEYKAGLVLMHIKGKPKTMQINPQYDDLTQEIKDFLSEKVSMAKAYGIKDVWVDVGIGFGKTAEDNLQLLKHIEEFNDLGAKQLLGISRKSFIGKLLGIEKARDRDLETLLFHSLLLNKNIDTIRVHNVKEYSTLKNIYKLLN